jgi:hypothetical protein
MSWRRIACCATSATGACWRSPRSIATSKASRPKWQWSGTRRRSRSDLTLGRPCVCDARTGYPRRPLSMRRACRPQPISRTRWPPSQLLDGRGIEGSAALSPASIRPRCHHREHDGYCASRHPQREALEFALDGIALDCCGHARSQEGLSQAKSLQATSGPTSRACCSLRKGNKQPRCCPKREGRLTSFTAALASQSSTERGTIPRVALQVLTAR